MSERTDRAFNALVAGLDRLEKSEARVSRANARGAALRALRDLRTTIDADYPPIGKTAKKKREPLTVPQKQRRLRKIDWAEVPSSNGGYLTAAARCGTKPVRVQAKGNPIVRFWLPRWIVVAVSTGVSDAELDRCKRSLNQRRAMLAAHSLQSVT